MQLRSASISMLHVPILLRGEAAPINRWIDECSKAQAFYWVALIFVGTGLFGAAMGIWRAPLQACYTTLKFPLVILLTTLGTALLNGMIAPLLGLNIRF